LDSAAQRLAYNLAQSGIMPRCANRLDAEVKMNRLLPMFLTLITLLTACAPQSADGGQLTLTPVESSPTASPTPEPAPEFTALQEKIAQSKDYTLMSNGSLEYQSKDSVVVVEGITVNRQTGEMTFTQNGQTLAVDETSVAINEKGMLTFQTEDGKAWALNGNEIIAKIDEHDLEPAYVQEVSREFMGVHINAELITDKSLDPVIRKVTVGESAYAEFIARTVFKVWWSKGEVKHSGTPTEKDFKDFMALWAKAQQSGLPEDWQKVQVNDIWANDLEDGNGYVQKPYKIWFMYDGQTPEGVRGISNLSIALVFSNRVDNITRFKNEEYRQGLGTNINNNFLFVYVGIFQMGVYGKDTTSGAISRAPTWLIRNTGDNFSVSGYPSWGDSRLHKLLRSAMTVILR
jgi:hypothetical protein